MFVTPTKIGLSFGWAKLRAYDFPHTAKNVADGTLRAHAYYSEFVQSCCQPSALREVFNDNRDNGQAWGGRDLRPRQMAEELSLLQHLLFTRPPRVFTSPPLVATRGGLVKTRVRLIRNEPYASDETTAENFLLTPILENLPGSKPPPPSFAHCLKLLSNVLMRSLLSPNCPYCRSTPSSLTADSNFAQIRCIRARARN